MTTASLEKWARRAERPQPGPQAQLSVEEFFPTLQQLAKDTGWLGMHTYNALGDDSGLQVILVRPGDAVLFAYIKEHGQALTPSQDRWQAAIKRVQRPEAHTWHPSDQAAIEARLRRGPSGDPA